MRYAFIFALRNITLGGYLDTRRTFTAQPMAGNIPIFFIAKIFCYSAARHTFPKVM